MRLFPKSLLLCCVWIALGVSGFPVTVPTGSEQKLHKQFASSAGSKLFSSSHEDFLDADDSSSSLLCDLDPESEDAYEIIRNNLGLSEQQHQQLSDYASLIVEWNERINLVSRKECSLEVVFGRHILPCLAPVALLKDSVQANSNFVDVGTGGGFPGIPLAISYPECDFLLIDSVGKKLKAVDDMTDRLGLNNVKTKHCRAEEVEAAGGFDYCVGRSVASLSKFCGWVSHLLKPDTGKLMYIIGGEVPEACLAEADESIHDILVSEKDGDNVPLLSDKRLLVFPQKAVQQMAKNSGSSNKGGGQQQRQKPDENRKKNRPGRRYQKAKGAWDKKEGLPKQRGYEYFQRYDSR